MKLYSSYIVKNLFLPTILIAVSLVCVAWLARSLRYIEIIINQGFPLSDFLYFVTLLIPNLLEYVLPIAVFISTIYVYNKLLYESELLVLRASGVSNFALAKPVLTFAIILTALGYIISLYAQPLTAREFRDMQFSMRDNYTNLLLREGVFNNPATGFTVYLRTRDESGLLRGILVHDSRDENKTVTMMAQEGRIESTETGLKFYMKNASRHTIDKKTGEVSILYFDSYPADISFYRNEDGKRILKKDERYLPELLYPESEIVGKELDKFNAEAHQRLTWPMFNISLPLLVVTILLAGDFNRRGQSRKILIAVIAGFSFILLAMALKNMVASGSRIAVYGLYITQFALISGCVTMLLSARFKFLQTKKQPIIEES